jgi:hypothetical protein
MAVPPWQQLESVANQWRTDSEPSELSKQSQGVELEGGRQYK